MNRPQTSIGTLAVVLLVAPGLGCTLHPVDRDPKPLVAGPDAWSLVTTAAAPSDAPAWWAAFGDPTLTDLIERALAANLGLGRGLARIAQAEALQRQSESLYLPQLDAVADGGVIWEEHGRTHKPAAAGLELAWEVDLFGRLRSAAQSRDAEHAATIEDFEAVRLLLSAEVAEAWYGAVEQRLQLSLLDEQLRLANMLVELTELRFRQGDASAVDVLQQRGVQAEVESEFPVARSRLRSFENRIDVLLGEAPDPRSRIDLHHAVFPAPEQIPPLGVPAELLVRRPDLSSLGRTIVASDHRVAEAIAARLPRVTLTGSAVFAGFASGGGEFAASLLGGLAQPLVDWGRRKAAVDFARAVHEEALLAFSEVYLVALEEVETTLWQERQQRELQQALARRVEVLEHTVEGTRWRYVQGITDYLPVLTAVRELQAAQRELLTRRRELVSLRIRLYLALGGPLPPDVRASAAQPSGLPRTAGIGSDGTP